MARQDLAFFTSPEHECSYLPKRRAGTLFVDPRAELDARIYTQLIGFGFRRSGNYVYRPRCASCAACVSVRIPVDEYRPRRNERRTWNRNQDIVASAAPPSFQEEHYQLYLRYVRARHPGGGMEDPEPEQYMEFLSSSWGQTIFYEYRIDEILVGLAVVDHLEDAISAVYTFFEPESTRRRLGVYAVLWEIELARRLGLSWLYLGYWIADCDKMSYKDRYRPLEAYVNGRWLRYERGEPMPR